MKTITKRGLFGLAAGVLMGATGIAAAYAADYPTAPITMLVGYGAGGQTDLVARAAAKVMSEQLGVPVNVVNKPGDRKSVV